MTLKHVYVFDEDIDIHDDRQVDWAMGTRFQADEDLVVLQGMMGMTMDPSLNGRRTGAKSGFDCTRPFGRDGEIPLMRCAAKVFKGPARYQTVEQALGAGAMFYADIVESLGSHDGREVACAIDELRQAGRLSRDRDGRYHLADAKPGVDRHRRRALSRPQCGDVSRRPSAHGGKQIPTGSRGATSARVLSNSDVEHP